MKLYTEEQIIKALFTYSHPESTSEELLKELTPIELPSDEEIEKQSQALSIHSLYEFGFKQGAKWMKEQLIKLR